MSAIPTIRVRTETDANALTSEWIMVDFSGPVRIQDRLRLFVAQAGICEPTFARVREGNIEMVNKVAKP
jgi:hypothetical protein